jgi:hypothetical protein
MKGTAYAFWGLVYGENLTLELRYLDGYTVRVFELENGVPNLELSPRIGLAGYGEQTMVFFHASTNSISEKPPKHLRRAALNGHFTKATLSYAGTPTISVSSPDILARLSASLR